MSDTHFSGPVTSTNGFIGSVTGPTTATTLTAVTTLTAAQSGSVIYINNATGFTTTLPAPAAGLNFMFINKLANTSGNHVISGGAGLVKGNVVSVAATAGSTSTAGAQANFVANQSVAGDRVEFYSDGTSWFGYGLTRVTAGITFS